MSNYKSKYDKFKLEIDNESDVNEDEILTGERWHDVTYNAEIEIDNLTAAFDNSEKTTLWDKAHHYFLLAREYSTHNKVKSEQARQKAIRFQYLAERSHSLKAYGCLTNDLIIYEVYQRIHGQKVKKTDELEVNSSELKSELKVNFLSSLLNFLQKLQKMAEWVLINTLFDKR